MHSTQLPPVTTFALTMSNSTEAKKPVLWVHGICPDHKRQRTRWKSHVFTVNSASVCMETMFAFPRLTWLVACCGRESLQPRPRVQLHRLISSLCDFQSTTTDPDINTSRFCWQRANKVKVVCSQHVHRKKNCFVMAWVASNAQIIHRAPVSWKSDLFWSFLYKEGQKM